MIRKPKLRSLSAISDSEPSAEYWAMTHNPRSIFRICGDLPFAVLPTKLLQDRRLTWEERGMLVDLLSRREDYEVNVSGLAKMSGHGRAKIYKLTQKAIELGYIRKLEAVSSPRSDGKFDTVVYQVFSLDAETRAKFSAVFDSDTRSNDTVCDSDTRDAVFDSDTGTCTKIEQGPCSKIEHKKNNKQKKEKYTPLAPLKGGADNSIYSFQERGEERTAARRTRRPARRRSMSSFVPDDEELQAVVDRVRARKQREGMQ